MLQRHPTRRDRARQTRDRFLGHRAGEAGRPFRPGPGAPGRAGQVVLEVPGRTPVRGGGPPPVRLHPAQHRRRHHAQGVYRPGQDPVHPGGVRLHQARHRARDQPRDHVRQLTRHRGDRRPARDRVGVVSYPATHHRAPPSRARDQHHHLTRTSVRTPTDIHATPPPRLWITPRTGPRERRRGRRLTRRAYCQRSSRRPHSRRPHSRRPHSRRPHSHRPHSRRCRQGRRRPGGAGSATARPATASPIARLCCPIRRARAASSARASSSVTFCWLPSAPKL